MQQALKPVRPNVSAFYGASAVAAAYCGLKPVPLVLCGIWQHGWALKHAQFHPDIVVQVNSAHWKDDCYWVARRDEEAYLHSQGYRNAQAIGLPVVYLPPVVVPRCPGTLLVMPVHSVDYTAHDWNFEAYAEAINAVRHQFAEVVVCVHPSCWKKGYWVETFQRHGYPVIQGMSADDGNALKKLQSLFSTFEYVTTNGLGSHIAYAATFGAKVSLYGPYPEDRAEDYAADPFFAYNPHLLEPALRNRSEEVMRQHYPELFCHPLEATERVEWGRHQVGNDNRVSPAEMRALFCWRARDLAVSRVRAAIPEPIKRWARAVLRRRSA